MRKFIVSVIVALVVLCGAGLYVFKTNDVSETYENKESNEVNNNMLSMMLETSAGSGEYQQTTASTWPTTGYVFNETLSKCEQGSSLSWDSSKNKVVMKGDISDKCYVYFDKRFTLTEYVISQYTGTQGENNLYYHDSALENGAGDNSYRYAGSSDTTNNYVCFGCDESPCPDENLYRIIGVFDNQVKLLYGNSQKGYYWNKSISNIYADSDVNGYLNGEYLINLGDNSNKIATHTWKVGGNTSTNISGAIPSTAYYNEIINPAEITTYDAKIGLMYASDYGFAANPDAWSTTLGEYDSSSIINENWMYLNQAAWTITRMSDDLMNVFIISFNRLKRIGGSIVYDSSGKNYSIYPTFYLNANVIYVSGNGTKNSPYIIK